MPRSIVFLAAALAGCASAESRGQDQPRIDAAPPIDAAPMVIDGPPVADCTSTDSCQAAMSLGTISGDTDNDKLTASGYRSAWFRVRVTEDVFGNLSLRASARVTSPSGPQFEVVTYLNRGDDIVECTSKLGETSTTGNVRLSRAEWGDTSFTDDDRFMSIEIRPLSGMCSTSEMWQLEVEGNWE